MKIGDNMSKNGIIVSGVYVNGIIKPQRERKADNGVKLFY